MRERGAGASLVELGRPMSAQWVSAISAAATLLIITASALAALVQIRHMRGANQLLALNELREQFSAPDFNDALLFVMREFPRQYADLEARRRMIVAPLPKEFLNVRLVGNFFENLGLLVKRGVIDGDIVSDLWGEAIHNAWKSLEPFITNRRYHLGNPASYDNFEYLAMVAERFKNRYPNGTYPAGFPRKVLPSPWTDV